MKTINEKSIIRSQEFLECLKEFEESYLRLLNKWFDDDNDIINEISHLGYPFESSFNEINIGEWVETYEEELKKIIEKK